ncbi:MAG: ATP-binding protein [Haliscomenobacter sp.]
MIGRLQERHILEWIDRGKAIVVTGPRQTGKTTLVRKITSVLDRAHLWLTGDDPAVRTTLAHISLSSLRAVVAEYRVLVIDEAQRLTNTGLTLKLLTDHFPGLQIFVTGSSALDLNAQIKESLVGRKVEFQLFPLSFEEMCSHHGLLQERAMLEQRLLYGYYPEVVNQGVERAEKTLYDLSDGLMYKDLLVLDALKKPSLLVKLLQALALQLGNEVRYHEVAQLIGADPLTVERYIDLLEQTFVLFRLPSLSRNARNEIKKGRKIYFYDNGIRNALIKNFNPLALRQDTGALWENFLVTERMKRNTYRNHYCNTWFWRTTGQQEIDYVEEYGGSLHAFEFKWHPQGKARFPQSFLEAYPGTETTLVHPGNFDAFLLG